jgi:hypothetical protein
MPFGLGLAALPLPRLAFGLLTFSLLGFGILVLGFGFVGWLAARRLAGWMARRGGGAGLGPRQAAE